MWAVSVPLTAAGAVTAVSVNPLLQTVDAEDKYNSPFCLTVGVMWAAVPTSCPTGSQQIFTNCIV